MQICKHAFYIIMVGTIYEGNMKRHRKIKHIEAQGQLLDLIVMAIVNRIIYFYHFCRVRWIYRRELRGLSPADEKALLRCIMLINRLPDE